MGRIVIEYVVVLQITNFGNTVTPSTISSLWVFACHGQKIAIVDETSVSSYYILIPLRQHHSSEY